MEKVFTFFVVRIHFNVVIFSEKNKRSIKDAVTSTCRIKQTICLLFKLYKAGSIYFCFEDKKDS